MADIRLPPTLPPLFPGLPRRLELPVTTVAGMLDTLEERWPGFRDRLCEPGLYFGTSTGQVFASPDAGDTWHEVASYLPGIASVEVAVVE